MQDRRFRHALSTKAPAYRGLARFAAAHSGGRFASAPWSMRIAAARASSKRAILWGLGGHVIKCGLAPVLIDLMRRGYATGVRHERLGRHPRFRNRARRPHQRRRGSGAARWPLRRGRRNRPRDEPRHRRGRARRPRHGRSAGPLARTHRATAACAPHSLLLQRLPQRDVPVTVHVAIGTDTPHTHPGGRRRGHRRRHASRFPPVLLAGRGTERRRRLSQRRLGRGAARSFSEGRLRGAQSGPSAGRTSPPRISISCSTTARA